MANGPGPCPAGRGSTGIRRPSPAKSSNSWAMTPAPTTRSASSTGFRIPHPQQGQSASRDYRTRDSVRKPSKPRCLCWACLRAADTRRNGSVERRWQPLASSNGGKLCRLLSANIPNDALALRVRNGVRPSRGLKHDSTTRVGSATAVQMRPSQQMIFKEAGSTASSL